MTFRLPPVAIGLVDELAAIVAAASPDASVSLSDVYRWAFDRYLSTRGYAPRVEPLLDLIGRPLVGVKLDGQPTRTVCVHISTETRQHFESMLEAQQAELGPMVAARLTTSQLYAAAVGSLLLVAGWRIPGWNALQGN